MLDEGVPKSVLRILQDLGCDAKRVQDPSRRGISNGEVFNLASSNDRVLLTRDTDFLKMKMSTERKLRKFLGCDPGYQIATGAWFPDGQLKARRSLWRPYVTGVIQDHFDILSGARFGKKFKKNLGERLP